MFKGPFRFKHLASAVLLAAPLLIAGCYERTSYGYRVYDNGYGDYHVYDRNEAVFYTQWVVETHRPHRDFKKLKDDDRREYWKWRHDHH